MDKFVINGGKKLHGDVRISGAKNAAVAIIPAAILAEDICRIENVPNINDVTSIARILQEMGAVIRMVNKSTLEIDSRHINSPVASYDLVRHMRASYYLLGALLGRFSHAKVALPGGCNFGVRPIDQHLKGFMALGAEYKLEGGMVNVSADHLTGNNVYLDVVSVGATMNIMLAAVKADGMTVIENAAREPHIVDLANFLNSMGADVRGAGTDIIKIRGVKQMKGATYSIIPDQIEAGTYMAAVAACGGSVYLQGVTPSLCRGFLDVFTGMGMDIRMEGEAMLVQMYHRPVNLHKICTGAYPDFPTDMQSMVLSVASVGEGTLILKEQIFENRFKTVPWLKKMGADITLSGDSVLVKGVETLKGSEVYGEDLRGTAALIIAGLAAQETTVIHDADYILRGYMDLCENLKGLGAEIEWENS